MKLIRKTRRSAGMLLALALFGLPACDLKYLDQEVLFQHDPTTDSLDVLIIYRGLTAAGDSPEALGKGLAIARRIVGGRREFEVSGWPGHVDLDDPAACEGLEPECAQALQSISIVAQEAFIDPEGRFSAYQLLRIPGFTRGLDCLNRSLSRTVLEHAGEAKPDEILDERTIALWIERAQSGLPWITYRDGVFELDLPASRGTVDAVQRSLIDDITMKSRPSEWSQLAAFLSHLQSFRREEDRVILRIGAPITGVFHLTAHQDGVAYFPGLLEALEDEGLTIAEDLGLAEVRRILLPEAGPEDP